MDAKTIRHAIAEQVAGAGLAWNGIYDWAVGEALRGVAEETDEATRQLSELRATLEDQERALAAERRARQLAQAVCYACQDYRYQLPGAVRAALGEWEGGTT